MDELSHDARSTVKRAADALKTLGGCEITDRSRSIIGDLIAIEFPELARARVDHHLAYRLQGGTTFTDETRERLANEVAMLIVFPLFVGIDMAAGPSQSIYTLIGPGGQRAFRDNLQEVLDLADEWGGIS